MQEWFLFAEHWSSEAVKAPEFKIIELLIFPYNLLVLESVGRMNFPSL